MQETMAVQSWLVGEPSLDELMSDDMMSRVVASAGMSPEEFRSRLAEVALRISRRARESGVGKSEDGPRDVAIGR
jgi:hypothetical protein